MIYAQIKKGTVRHIVIINNNSQLPDYSVGYDYLVNLAGLNPMPNIGWNYNGGTSFSEAPEEKIKKSYRMTATQSNSTTTFSALSGLTSTSLPVGNYKIYVAALIQTAALGTGIGLRLNSVTATLNNIGILWSIPTNNDLTANCYTNGIYTQRAVSDNFVTPSIGTANQLFRATGEGCFSVTVEGTVAIEIRSETTTVATVGVGSILMIEEV